MPPASFPAFEDWKSMSEVEQDALLARLEASRRRGALVRRLLIGLALSAAVAALAAALVLPGLERLG